MWYKEFFRTTQRRTATKKMSRGADLLAKAFFPVRKKLVGILVRGASAK